MATLIDVAILTAKKAELEAEMPRLRSALEAHAGAISFIDHLLSADVPKVELAEAELVPPPEDGHE